MRKAKFVKSIGRAQALRRFPHGVVSKQALLVKKKITKDEVVIKRRVVVDLRRSGANTKSVIPQRIVLPRPIDVINDVRNLSEEGPLALTRLEIKHSEKGEWGIELATADLSDAYQNFRIHQCELENCLSMDEEGQEVLVWIMLGFGFDSAPLLFGRFMAAMARLLQGMADPSLVRLQCYLDDPLWELAGTPSMRRHNLAAQLWTMLALGCQMA